MMSWAVVIDSLQSVAGIYRYPYQALAGSGETLPYTVLAPAQDVARNKKSAERLLCDLGDSFFVLERAGPSVESTCLRYADVASLEVGNILLYSWFTVCGMTTDGSEAALTVEFNEATLRHFKPFFRKMRPAAVDTEMEVWKTEQEKFECLSQENFKLMSFARENLIPGEKVISMIYQPGIRRRLVTVFGRSFFRSSSLAHLTILTDKEVILLGDSENITKGKPSKYGGVQRYLPVNKLVSAELDEPADGQLRLTLGVSHGRKVQLLYGAFQLHGLIELKQAIETLMEQNSSPGNVFG